MISQYVIPGIVRVLQNSPELKKLTRIHTFEYFSIPEGNIVKYLQSLKRFQCWSLEARVIENMRHFNIGSKHVASFMEVMLKNTKTLETMVVRLESYKVQIFQELLEMVPMLSDKNNVTIVLSSSHPESNQRD